MAIHPHPTPIEPDIAPSSGVIAVTRALQVLEAFKVEESQLSLAELSRRTGLGQDVLVHDFGLHLARVFAKKFSVFFDACDGTFDFLKRIDNHIHVEVKKLYPDAQLPKFTYTEISPYEFELKYESSRDFSHLAHGLIVGCMEHFHESFQIEREDVAASPDTQVIFKLRRFIK